MKPRLIQFTWIYDRAIDLDRLRRFHANLGFGLLGRRIERSALPFGRDRWVTASGPPDVQIAARNRPRGDVWTWADERLRLPVDPQQGPSWHLGVQPLKGGGADAVQGVRRDLGYPPPDPRARRQAVRDDGKQALRDIPAMAKAVVSAARVARAESEGLSTSSNLAASSARAGLPARWGCPMRMYSSISSTGINARGTLVEAVIRASSDWGRGSARSWAGLTTMGW